MDCNNCTKSQEWCAEHGGETCPIYAVYYDYECGETYSTLYEGEDCLVRKDLTFEMAARFIGRFPLYHIKNKEVYKNWKP